MQYTELYNYLESVLQDPDFISSEIKKRFGCAEDPQLKKIAELESQFFDFYFDDGSLEPIASSQNEQGQKHTYPDLAKLSDEDVEYLRERVIQANNSFIKARYAHLLHIITHHNSYAVIAADNYLAVSNAYIQFSLQHHPQFHNYIQVLHAFHNLCAVSKHDIGNCRTVLLSALSVQEFPPLWKDNIADIIVDSTIFKRNHCIGLTDKLLSYLPKDKPEDFDRERYLKTCVRLAKKEGRDVKDIYNLLGENELQSASEVTHDNSGMIELSHYQQATHYFKLAGNKDRQQYAAAMYTRQKSNIRMSLIRSELDQEKTKQLLEAQDAMINKMYESGEPLAHIAYNNAILLNEEALEQAAHKSIKTAGFLSFVSTEVFDKNNNSSKLENNEDRLDHARTQIYIFNLQMHTIPILFKFIRKGIKGDKLTTVMVLEYLNCTWYAGTLSEFTVAEEPEKFTWIDLIQPGLVGIFNQFESKLHDKKYQENYILCIDSLATKIEGIIRDLARLNGFTVTKIKDKETSEVNLEDMLGDEKIRNFFSSEDRMLFRYTLTRRGWNIRNNIAHAFYRPSDYSPEKAILLFLCIFRLSRYQIASEEAVS